MRSVSVVVVRKTARARREKLRGRVVLRGSGPKRLIKGAGVRDYSRDLFESRPSTSKEIGCLRKSAHSITTQPQNRVRRGERPQTSSRHPHKSCKTPSYVGPHSRPIRSHGATCCSFSVRSATGRSLNFYLRPRGPSRLKKRRTRRDFLTASKP